MPRVGFTTRSKELQGPPRKKRRFFSAVGLPPLQIVRPASSSPAIASDRVLAALQPDAQVVIAAKTFVKEKMGDDKWEVADKSKEEASKARVTRHTVAVASLPPTKRRSPPPRKVPVAKVQPKRLAVGSGSSIAQRIKAKTAVGIRKITLRSHAPPKPAPPPLPTPVVQPTVAIPKIILKQKATDTSTTSEEPNPSKRKLFRTSGLYSNDGSLADQVLEYRKQQPKKRGRPSKTAPIPTTTNPSVSFPPLPQGSHYDKFFGQVQEFKLPFNIMWESETGALDSKKRHPFYQKIRTNQFVERSKISCDRMVCRCDPELGCGDNCLNLIMSYLCGSDCPCGDQCGNKSLARRTGKATKVVWTGSRGFGLFAAEDIKEGEFVTDYRGEIIHINTFIERIGTTYGSKRNFYALAYDKDEVIDAGMRGNDTRFINHGCSPNLEVRKYGTVGDGYDEYEVGVWAVKDIKAGEELFYDYNFDSFAVTVNRDKERQQCKCGASNCVGFLGRKQGEKSAKELAQELSAKTPEPSSSLSKKGNNMDSATSSKRATATPSVAAAATQTTLSRGRGRRSLDDAALEPDVPPAKRPVGRPRKSLPAPIPAPMASPTNRLGGRPRKSLPAPVMQSKTEPVPAKRPVGRPRKVVAQPAPQPEPEPVRRTVGRPRKATAAREPEPATQPASEQLKRPVGRPRKSAPDPTESSTIKIPPPQVEAVRPARAHRSLPEPVMEEPVAESRRGVGRPRKSLPAGVANEKAELAEIAVGTSNGRRRRSLPTAPTDLAVEAPAEVPKRGVGRPRKSEVSAIKPTSSVPKPVARESGPSVTIDAAAATPAASGAAENISSTATEQPALIKRGPGRPRKLVPPPESPLPNPVPVVEETTPRRVGRPRKSSIAPAVPVPPVERVSRPRRASTLRGATVPWSPWDAPGPGPNTSAEKDASAKTATSATLTAKTAKSTDAVGTSTDGVHFSTENAPEANGAVTANNTVVSTSGTTGTATVTEVPTKRKRGRPPKPRPEHPPPKRPRGRPRIHPLPDPSAPVIKRPRGRPRKNPVPDGTEPAVGKAKRGRPPKNRPAPYTIPGRSAADAEARVKSTKPLKSKMSKEVDSPAGPLHAVSSAVSAAVSTVGSALATPLKLKFTMPGFTPRVLAENNGEVTTTTPQASDLKDNTANGVLPAKPAHRAKATFQVNGTRPAVPAEQKDTPKQAAKARRNGAPAGWAYVAVAPSAAD